VDPFLQHRAMQRATRLLLDIVGGQAGPVIEVSAPGQLPERAPITLRKARIERVLGMLPGSEEVVDILERLGMAVVAEESGWQVTPPTYRFDVAIEADLIEEIGRVYGYDRLPLQPMTGALEIQPLAEAEVSLLQVMDILVARGYQEAVTYSFVDPDFQSAVNPDMQAIALANPISTEMSVMRTSLWPGLLNAAAYNLKRQRNRLRLFEHGLRFYRQDNEIKQDIVIGGVLAGSRNPEHWASASEPVDFYDIKGDVEAVLALTGRADEYHYSAAAHPALHPGQCAGIRCRDRHAGWVGRVHPVLAEQYDLDATTLVFQLEFAALQEGSLAKFTSISRYPSIRRDLAVVVDDSVPVDRLCSLVRDAAGDLLQELVIFDVYQGKGIETGRKSIAFGLILQDSSRTLTDKDTEALVARVTGSLGNTIGATLRE
jgi:phenylalanyl-tRNA synthetase beta chain